MINIKFKPIGFSCATIHVQHDKEVLSSFYIIHSTYLLTLYIAYLDP